MSLETEKAGLLQFQIKGETIFLPIIAAYGMGGFSEGDSVVLVEGVTQQIKASRRPDLDTNDHEVYQLNDRSLLSALTAVVRTVAA